MATSADAPPHDDAAPTAPGLGMMPSMTSECTPLKHRYDACFNHWFEEYLGLSGEVGRGSGSGPSSSIVDSAASSSSSSSGGRNSFWSSTSPSSSSASSGTTDGAQRSPTERKALRDRLQGECGAMWREYQGCVLRAVKTADLEGLIADARVHNPFPFPKDVPQGRPNNEPFPFPAADSTKQ